MMFLKKNEPARAILAPMCQDSMRRIKAARAKQKEVRKLNQSFWSK